jgi:peptide-methionine (R)-S-oxide reductase
MTKLFYLLLFITAVLYSCNTVPDNNIKTTTMDNSKKSNPVFSKTDTGKVTLSNEEWKTILPENVYEIAREKGTERAFTGKYWNTYDTGLYHCAVCGNALFRSNGKFESSCGWPSFFEPVTKGSLIYLPDNSHGMKRTEVECGRCKSHLGHVFEDGPPPTGLRYCINGNVLNFEKAPDEKNSAVK